MENNNSLGIFGIKMKSYGSDKEINFGKIQKGKLNLFTNFKPYVFADVINKSQDYFEVIEVMTINGTTFGMVVDLKEADIMEFIPELAKALNIYEHQDAVG